MSIIIALALLSVFLGSFAQIFLRKGMLEIGEIGAKEILSKKVFEIIFQKYVFLGLAFFVLNTLVWLALFSKKEAEVTFVLPLLALGYIVTTILAKILFNENLTIFRISGIALIVIGVVLIVRT
ncbi:MAG: hypothetical protein QW140_00825 [Candidatus Aenigmatarchaeota archaeon]